MMEAKKENQKCPHCGSEEVEQYTTADKAKFHEEVKAKGVIIPPPPKKIGLGIFLLPVVIFVFGYAAFDSMYHFISSMPFILLINLCVLILLTVFPICLGYNIWGYPAAYSNWCNTYVCYRCGRNFIMEPSLPASWFIRRGKLVKLFALYAFSISAVRLLVRITHYVSFSAFMSGYNSPVRFLYPVSRTDSFLLFKEILTEQGVVRPPEFYISHMVFYMIPIAGLLWLMKKRQSGAALIFTSSIGLVGLLDHAYSFLFSVKNYLFYSKSMLLNSDMLLFLVLTLVFTFMAYKIFRISKSLYGQNFHTDKFKIAGTLFLFAFCYALPFLQFLPFPSF